ncbi:MAG: hypothetical protein MJZ40_00975 [Bacteroidaceae bacterium]|nr:hypothetical protein [Bacteroidaceae bacterium]
MKKNYTLLMMVLLSAISGGAQERIVSSDSTPPNYETVLAAMEEAREFQKAVEWAELIGSEVGDFENGADNELRAALDKVNFEPTSSAEECQKAMDAIKKALEAFHKKMRKPANGKYYLIKCRTRAGENWYEGLDEPTEEQASAKITRYADNDYLGSYGSDLLNVGWGGEGLSFESDNKYAGYFWQAEDAEDGTFRLRHLLTGRYLSCSEENDTNVFLSDLTDPFVTNFTYQSAKIKYGLNVVFADKVYMNAQPETNNVVTWNSASGTDNSAFEFIDIENEGIKLPIGEDGWSISLNEEKDNGMRIMTLPVDICNEGGVNATYAVAGVSTNEDKYYIELVKTDAEIPAGTPFIIEYKDNTISLDKVTFGVTTTENKEVNGLQGVLTPCTLDTPDFLSLGLYNDEWTANLIQASESEKVNIAASYGFFTGEMPKVEYGTGVKQIWCPDGVPTSSTTSISTITDMSTLSKGSFDLQGRRIQKTVKGLYIINDKKVLAQ